MNKQKNEINNNLGFDEKKLLDAKIELESYLKNYEIWNDLKTKIQEIVDEIDYLIKVKENGEKKGIKKLLQNIKKTLKVLKDIFLTVDNTAKKVNNCLDSVSSGIWQVVNKVEDILFP